MADETPYLDFASEDGACTITLKRGLMVGETKVMAIVMREPDVGDQLAAQKVGDGDAGMIETTLIANLCGYSPDEIRKLKLCDYKRTQAALMGFTD